MLNDYWAITKELGLNLSWTFIKIGMQFIEYDYRITPETVVCYAESLIESGDSEALLTDLILSADSKNKIEEIVEKLSKKEDINYDVEKRKWTVCVLKKFFDSLNCPPTREDLFLLSDIWLYLGCPKHYPWNVLNNEYIKCNDIQNMIDVHRDWITKEADSLLKE